MSKRKKKEKNNAEKGYKSGGRSNDQTHTESIVSVNHMFMCFLLELAMTMSFVHLLFISLHELLVS